jgi:hypothetical protein
MDAATLFLIANSSVIPFWMLLVFAPHHRVTNALVHSMAGPVLFAVAYAVLVITGPFLEPQPPGTGSFFSLDGVQTLLANPWSALTAWVHYLAFDLFVGAWEVRDAKRRGLAHRYVVVPLGFTLMFGPIGLLLYFGVRWRVTSRIDRTG